MENFLRNFDRLSFWLGFLAASLFWFLISRLRPALARLRAALQEQSQAAQLERSQVDEIRLANDTLQTIQRWHLAAPMFSLDELLIPPRLICPPLPPQAYEPPPHEDITDWAIPYTPDWPELASYYNAPWLSPAEALQGGANLAIIGQPGSGKTVALAYLALQVIRKAPEAGNLTQLSPIVVHAGDLLNSADADVAVWDRFLAAISVHVTSISAKRLPDFIGSLLKQERALLLVDGLDELAPPQFEQATQVLEELLKQYPRLRVVVTAHPRCLGRLPRLGFQPLPLASWGFAQRALLISRWSDLWNQYIINQAEANASAADPLLVIGWLLNNTENLTPLEITLKVWAAMAGDSLGPGSVATIEAYIRRLMVGQPDKNRAAVEQLAAQAILAQQTVIKRQIAEKWLGGSDSAAVQSLLADEEGVEFKRPDRVRAKGALPDLLECGLLTQRVGDCVSIQHPVVSAYLAAQKLAEMGGGMQLLAQAEWSGRSAALQFLSIADSQGAWLGEFITDSDGDPTQQNLLEVCRWLRIAPEGLSWVPNAMRRLAGSLQKDGLPLSLKARLTIGLAQSGKSGVAVLLRQMAASPDENLRQLAALGLGLMRDAKSTQEIIRLLSERSPAIYRAAILALTSIGDKAGLEAVASVLISGDDSQRRAAAEGLANHPEEGHPTLEEASAVEDPAVRRAAVFGLGRIRQPWAIKILEKLRAEDSQWVVQDAAHQVLSAIQEANPRTPRRLPALTQLPWLIALAAERGMGVAPGKPAFEMLYRALKEGTPDQKLAAIYYLSERGDENAVLPLSQMYFSSTGELRERAFDALYSLSAAGAPLPDPAQYGLR
jgi:HEAT repeat protein